MPKKYSFLALVLLLNLLLVPVAVSAQTFNPNMVITDNDLTDYTTMGVGEIYDFLKEKDSTLLNYIDPTVKMTIPQYIQTVAWSYRINPKYILVLLQKEQGLITDPDPVPNQYKWAAGYGCPDGKPCTEKYQGLTNQIDWGAGAVRYYLDNPNQFKYKKGETYNIDGELVTMLNDATRAMYTYTPHVHGNELLHNIWNTWFSKSYLDGMLLQNSEDGGIYLVDNGTKRPFTTKSAFVSRYSPDKVVTVSPSELEKYDIGPAISHTNYSLLKIPSGGIYLLDNDTARPVVSMEVFRILGLNPEEVIDIEEEELQAYVLGEAIDINSSYPTGGLVQDNTTGGVYYVQDGKKHPIWSKQLMLLYYDDMELTAISPEELAKYPTMDPVKFKDGELVKSKDDAMVYFISKGQRRPVKSESDFIGMGFKWENIITTDLKILQLHPLGAEIHSDE